MSEQDGDADVDPSGESRQERDESEATDAGEASTADRAADDAAETADPTSASATDETDADDGTESPPGLALALLDPDAGEPDHLDAVRAEVDTDEVSVEDRLLTAVREASPERLGLTLAVLETAVEQLEAGLTAERERAAELEAETEDLESRLARKQADFQNYKQRQQDRLEEEKARATEDLVTRLLDVRDNLQRALDQGESADIRDGVASTLAQFDRELDREDVERIEPAPGDGVDPRRHEALATVPAAQPEGTVAEVHRPGYEMAGKVLRPAQVAVSDGSGADSDDGGGDGDTEAEDEDLDGDDGDSGERPDTEGGVEEGTAAGSDSG